MFDAERGARTTLYLALAPELAGLTGCYFDEDQSIRAASPLARNVAEQERLLAMSARWVGLERMSLPPAGGTALRPFVLDSHSPGRRLQRQGRAAGEDSRGSDPLAADPAGTSAARECFDKRLLVVRLAMHQTGRSRATEVLLFARNFFMHPMMLGSIIPSSRFLVNQVLEPIDWARARVIVEYGPGVGTITAEILRRMSPEAHLVAIETNRDFVKFVRNALPDSRLHVVQDSAAQVQSVLARLGLPAADYIVSGIPLGSMPEPVRTDIVSKSRAALAPGGKFLVYQFTSRCLPALQRTFAHVRRSFERRNLPPAQLFVCATDLA